jgi:YebC/PmpR family DNA-binding regulatory protein
LRAAASRPRSFRVLRFFGLPFDYSREINVAGHSHWAGIKHKKAVNDKKRGKIFSKIARMIWSAVKEGGGPDPEFNPRLRLILDKAKAANMPKDNIKRAIDRAVGGDGDAYEQVFYEGYAPGGVAVMVDTLTDNRNRTYPEIRKIIEGRGGNLGNPGCVAYLFQRKGTIYVPAAETEEDALLEAVLEAGGEDMREAGGFYEVITEPEALSQVKDALDAKEIPVESAELSMLPDTSVPLGSDEARKVLALMEDLDDHDDVQNVYANFDLPDDVLAEVEAEAG